jgi:hypothetical protein
MLKQIVLGTLLVGLIGILVAGAVFRTMDRTGNVAEARGLGRGLGNGGNRLSISGRAGQPSGYGGAGRIDAPGDGTGTGQAQVDEWLPWTAIC